jgi:signal transduction histidine kinase/DNA-binding response OmpR family regulator
VPERSLSAPVVGLLSAAAVLVGASVMMLLGTSQAVLPVALGSAAWLLVLLALGVYLVRTVLRPMRTVVATAGAARKQLEQAVQEAQEASRMKSGFLANMSHEIRTPLNGVVGMLTLLSDTNLDPQQREYVDIARSSSDALMTVVNDVLDIAKIEAGRLELEHRDFDLHELIEASCDMVAANALSKGVELQSFVHDDVPRAVRGDRVRTGQILVNLVANAVKFTPEGEVVAEVSVDRRTDTRVDVRFEVRDTGIGIAADRVRRLFEPFMQADAATTRTFGGTGLGLAISRQLSQLMGGTIEAQSELGKGSTFRFVIPFAAAREPLACTGPAEELRDLRVLVVDDHATNRRILEAYVTSWGMCAAVAADAAAALNELRRAARVGTPFDVVLLDQNMPGETGLELARRIAGAPVLSRARLILLTSSVVPGAACERAGVFCQLTKPLHRSRLLGAINQAMANRPTLTVARGDVSPAATACSEPRPVGCRILVAEDQNANWILIDRMLARRGHSAVNAADGGDTLALLESGRYDLILMDCQMPTLDGYDTTREIRRRTGAHGSLRIPIVAMTASAMLGDRERCLAAGMDDYLAKPIRLERLDEVLLRWLPVAGNGEILTLDQARLDELRALFPGEEMKRILRTLAAEITDELAQVTTAASAGSHADLAAAAHRIRNSARLLGATTLVEAAAPLELSRDAVGRMSNGNGTTVDELFQQWTMTRAAIEAELMQAV